MKRVLFTLLFGITLLTVNSQQLVATIKANLFCQKPTTEVVWGEWQSTNATFYMYKTGTLATKIVIETEGGTTLTFIGYADEKIVKDNGDYLYITYCYEEGDNSSKTYDKSEFIRLPDHKDEQATIILLSGRDTNDYAWQVKSLTKL